MHIALQSIKSYNSKNNMSRSTNLSSLVSLAQSFLAPKDPTSKKFFFDSGACSLHPTETATTKTHRLGQDTYDLQVWDRRCISFDQCTMSRTNFHKPLRGGTCHVPRASRTPEKYKSTRPPGGSIHPENLVQIPRTVSTPESRNLDRQTEGGMDDRQKIPTYIPSINI